MRSRACLPPALVAQVWKGINKIKCEIDFTFIILIERKREGKEERIIEREEKKKTKRKNSEEGRRERKRKGEKEKEGGREREGERV